MRNNIILSIALSLLITGLLETSVRAASHAAGKAIAQRACQTCHGMNGIGTVPMAANLAGQQEIYIVAQLKAYKSGKRRHEQMSIIAGMLNDQDIADVAAWYSGIKITVEMPE